MIHFDLSGAHPQYEPLVRRVIEPLDREWPRACRAVRLGRAKSGDTSLGKAVNGTIELNPYWLLRPPVMLREAGMVGMHHGVIGLPRWHGTVGEPEHVLTHEFGHCLRQALGQQALDVAKDGFRRALARPEIAPTGYAFGVDPEEYWAETFMISRLGSPREKSGQLVEDLQRFLFRVKTAGGRR